MLIRNRGWEGAGANTRRNVPMDYLERMSIPTEITRAAPAVNPDLEVSENLRFEQYLDTCQFAPSSVVCISSVRRARV